MLILNKQKRENKEDVITYIKNRNVRTQNNACGITFNYDDYKWFTIKISVTVSLIQEARMYTPLESYEKMKAFKEMTNKDAKKILNGSFQKTTKELMT